MINLLWYILFAFLAGLNGHVAGEAIADGRYGQAGMNAVVALLLTMLARDAYKAIIWKKP